MIKKLVMLILTAIMFSSTCYAQKTPEPTKKIVLFYKVPDTILECQNSKEDMVAGQKTLEKELKAHYSKRFLVREIKRLPIDSILTPKEYFAKAKLLRTPFIVKITLAGQGTSQTLYQNAYGAKTVGVSPVVKVHLVEGIPDKKDNQIYIHDYGIKSYGSGTFAVGRHVYTAQTDPRKNTKNAVRGCFRDACKFTKTINKYADSDRYKNEYNRYAGNFKALSKNALNSHSISKLSPLDKIEKFKIWCSADPNRSSYLAAVDLLKATPTSQIVFIDQLQQLGVYN